MPDLGGRGALNKPRVPVEREMQVRDRIGWAWRLDLCMSVARGSLTERDAYKDRHRLEKRGRGERYAKS